MDDKRAYFWPGEAFTRLLISRQYDGSYKLHLYLRPLQAQYSSPDEYREIVCVAMQDDYKTSALKYRFEFKCNGIVKRTEVLSRDDNWYLRVFVEVPKTAFWNVGAFEKVGGLTVTFSAYKGSVVSQFYVLFS